MVSMRNRVLMRTTRVLLACAVALAASAAAHGADADAQRLFRFELDNDTFLGSDDAFSAGWSVQIHSPLLDEWPHGLAGWIGRLPTLDNDGEGDRVVRWSWGITQFIITPRDVTIAAPQPNDAPWAGILGGYASWSAYDDRRLAAFQMYLGCIGPCSRAEEAQTFVHRDLGLGATPAGWRNQIDDNVLFNLGYEYRHKLWAGSVPYETNGLRSDLSVGTQAGVGSFATYAEVWLEYRFGWNLPRGFAKLADPPAFGIAIDPMYLDPSGSQAMSRSWKPYFDVVARRRTVHDFAPLKPSGTENGGYFRPEISTPGDQQLILGLHFGNDPFALHLTYYRYLDGYKVAGRFGTNLDWVNLSFERRF